MSRVLGVYRFTTLSVLTTMCPDVELQVGLKTMQVEEKVLRMRMTCPEIISVATLAIWRFVALLPATTSCHIVPPRAPGTASA